MRHEIGHIVGLTHTTVDPSLDPNRTCFATDAVMSVIDFGGVYRGAADHLSAGEREAVRRLYSQQ